MLINKVNIRREKLAEFVPDHDTIKQLELLIEKVNAIEIVVRVKHGIIDADHPEAGDETLAEMAERLLP